MEAGSDGVEDGARERKPPPRSAALALAGPGAGAGGGGGVEEVVCESSRRPRSTAPAFGAPVSSGGSGGGGPGGRLRDVGTEAFEQLVAEGHVEETAAGFSAESRDRLEARFGRLPARSGTLYMHIYETISFVIDNPSQLSELPALLSEIGVNIIDAHAFSRRDRSINDFIVECWPIEDPKGLHKVLVALFLINMDLWSGFGSGTTNLLLPFHTDDCESNISATLLNIGEEVTSGSCGVMFHGTHSGTKIAFGILSLAYLDQNAWSKFTKEIHTSRNAHHANIARLLGQCTKPHQFCTKTEYMCEGSLFCFLRNEHVVLELSTFLKLAQNGGTRIDYLCHKGTVHWNANPAGLLKHKDQVVGLGKFGLPRSKDQEKARTAKTETHQSMVPEFQSCETTLATNQSLDRLVPVLEKILEQLSKQYTVLQEFDGTASVESLATEEEAKKLMEMFNKILVDCVLFALPQVLIFFPRYEVKPKEESNQRFSLLKITQDAGGSSSEKSVVISFFVIFVTVWFLGLLLSQFGRGQGCTSWASVFTACAAICTIAFVDYSLCKCLPEDTLSLVLFALHFAVMVIVIGYVWLTYIKVPQLPTIKWRRDPLLHVHGEPKDETQAPLLTHVNEIV